MKMFKLKVNLSVLFFIAVITITIVFIDNNTLNSLYINYNDNLLITEVNTHKEETVVSDNNPSTTNNVTMINYQPNQWVWPTTNNYIITQYYSYYHNAIDISGNYNSSIYAANSGTISTVKNGCTAGNLSCNGRGGNYIIIKHNINNYYTIYMHLKDIYVSEGQTISSGQEIGTMGNTGNVIPVPTNSNPYAGTHLHFSLYIGEPFKGGYSINPMNLY